MRPQYSGLFSKTKPYREAADFPTITDKPAASTLRESGERGELDGHFGDKLDANVLLNF